MDAIFSLRDLAEEMGSYLLNVTDNNNTEDIQKWIISQLNNLTFELNALLIDLEVGITMDELGFLTNGQLMEQIEDIRSQYMILKSQLKMVRDIL